MSIQIRKRSIYDYNTVLRRNAILRGQCYSILLLVIGPLSLVTCVQMTNDKRPITNDKRPMTLRIILIAHPFQKGDRLFHLVHAIHAILNTHPAIVAGRFENGKNLVIVIQAFAGDAVA